MRRILVLAGWLAGVALAGDHVRVILDNSGSMTTNDRPRLATLATLLLYDLADSNLTLGDTFEVLTFDSAWESGKWKSGPPPEQNGPRIKAVPGRRAVLANDLKSVPYNARNTYYYPVLKEAITDLCGTPGGLADRRVAVLITDGIPEDHDTSLIGRELLTKLVPNHIRLYVIAFGPEANSQRAKLQSILDSPGVGEIVIDPDGSGLLESMIGIFSSSFGYSFEPPRVLGGPLALNLDGGRVPARVALVTYWRKPEPPGMHVTPPRNGILNIPEGVQTAEEAGASYRAAWIIRPNPGDYTLAGDSPGASVAVLRPANLLVSVIPQPPLEQTQVTMARKEFPMRIMVRLPAGVRGDPGEDLKFSSQSHGSAVGGGYEWDGRVQGARLPNGTSINSDGRYYDIAPEFPDDRDTVRREFYEGWLTAIVQRGEAALGSNRHRVLVYPFMKLSSTPPVASAMTGGLVKPVRTRETGCARFEFRLDGMLPHPGRPVYSVQAVVDKRLIGDPRLPRARFTLDGVPLEYEGVPGPVPSPWYTGQRLGKEALLGTHEVCLQGGRPRSADPSEPVDIPIQFALMEAPYDGLQAVDPLDPIIEPMRLRALIAPPTFLEKYASLLALGIGALMLLIMAWYARYRPILPPFLRWAVALRGSPSGPVPGVLGDAPVWRRLLGLPVDRIAYADNGSRPLGSMRPMGEDLYAFEPASGVILENPAPAGENGLPLAARRDYVARTGVQGEFVFRVECE